MRCRNPDCNNIYDEKFKYCPYCGKETPPPKYCVQCSDVITERDFKYCPNCGGKLRDYSIGDYVRTPNLRYPF